MTKLYTIPQRSLLEELEAVIERRLAGGKVSVVCVAGVTAGLAEIAQQGLEAAQYDDASEAIGIVQDEEEEDDGDGWKKDQPKQPA